MYIISAVVLVLVYIFDRERLQFDTKAFYRFLKILFIGSCLSIVVNYLAGRLPLLPPVAVSSLLLVWQEDIIFSCLLLYYLPKILPEHFQIPIMIMTSFVFGYMHLYQGIVSATLVSIYPYVSLYFGKRYGWGTVCVSHVTYDLSVYFICWTLHAI